LQRERAPIRGWISAESAGRDRDWGEIENPFSNTKTLENVKAADNTAVSNMLFAADIRTVELLYAPPATELRPLFSTASRIVHWLNSKEANKDSPASSPSPAVVARLSQAASAIPADKQIANLRSTQGGRIYPKLSIHLERTEDRSEFDLAERIRNQYGYKIATIHGGILTARFAIPATSKTRKSIELVLFFLYDRDNSCWVTTSIEIRPDGLDLGTLVGSGATRADIETIMTQQINGRHTIDLVTISPDTALLATNP
jgi:hypothetical protein